MSAAFARLAWVAAALTLAVVVLGAYVRLTHAGLGCPDWPVCYGKATWPRTPEEVAAANLSFPDRPVEPGKAWREQVHRHLAAALGTLIVGLALLATWRRPARRWLIIAAALAAAGGTVAYLVGWTAPSLAAAALAIALPLAGVIGWRDDPRARLSAGLLALVIFQAMLGMWTVTLLLKPAIVTAHLLGGLTTLALLVWLAARSNPPGWTTARALRPLALLALIALGVQVLLGGWTSANYAALACPDLPRCQGQWWPEMNFREAFVLWRGIGVDYEGGILDWPARTAIHLAHRAGAVVVTGLFVLVLWRLPRQPGFGAHAAALGVLLIVQLALGTWNVLGGLPLAVAVAHNAVAALLLIAVVLFLFRTREPSQIS